MRSLLSCTLQSRLPAQARSHAVDSRTCCMNDSNYERSNCEKQGPPRNMKAAQGTAEGFALRASLHIPQHTAPLHSKLHLPPTVPFPHTHTRSAGLKPSPWTPSLSLSRPSSCLFSMQGQEMNPAAGSISRPCKPSSLVSGSPISSTPLASA